MTSKKMTSKIPQKKCQLIDDLPQMNQMTLLCSVIDEIRIYTVPVLKVVPRKER
jgi:hypothetical protein